MSAFIPYIAVICFEKKKSYAYTNKIQSCGYFELYNVTNTDRNRGLWYQQQKQREMYRESVVDVKA